MNISFKQLEAFVWVADLGSFRKAALRLNTTQPNISVRISSLESALDVTLMIRDAGSVRLTPKGQEMLVHARSVLRQADTFVAASGNEALVNGALRLGVTELIVHTWLPDFLTCLKEKFPSVVVEFTVDLSVNITRDLREKSIDLAFQNGPFDSEVSGNIDLGSYPLIWVASSELNVAGGGKVSFDALAAHPILTPARDTKPFDDLTRHLSQFPQLSPRLVPSSSLSASLHMTTCAMGVAALPAAMVAKELNTGQLVKVDYDWTPADLDFVARYDSERSPGFVATAARLAGEIAGNHV